MKTTNYINNLIEENLEQKIKMYKAHLDSLYKKYDNCRNANNPHKCRERFRKKIRYWKNILSRWKGN